MKKDRLEKNQSRVIYILNRQVNHQVNEIEDRILYCKVDAR